MPLLRFGFAGTSQTYDFTQSFIMLGRFKDNFRQLDEKVTDLPGSVGGYDQQGTGLASQRSGVVTQELTLVARSRAQMSARRDAINAMPGWGKQRLYMQPSDSTAAERYCDARVLDVDYDREEGMYTDLHQPFRISWSVAYPRWLTEGSVGAIWGIATYGDATWPGIAVAASGTITDTVLTNTGNAITTPQITIACGAGQTAENPTVQRIVSGAVVDEVTRTMTLGNSETLVIDARDLSVLYEGADAFDSAFDYDHPAWMRLLPGSNTIRIRFANAGDAATVTFKYNDAYFGV